MNKITILFLASALPLEAQHYTRGIGAYPGDPKEDFSPLMALETEKYRNLALLRPAYHSSSHDYNLTAQLVTDGIRHETPPRWISISTSRDGKLSKDARERPLDRNPVTFVEISKPSGWLQVELGGGDAPLEVDRLDFQAQVDSQTRQPEEWRCVFSASKDGRDWTELGRAAGIERLLTRRTPWGAVAMKEIAPSLKLASPSRSRFYRIEFEASKVNRWMVGEVLFYREDERLAIGGPYDFTSAWKSAGNGEEWVSVDLGATCTFDRLVLHWIRRAAEGAVQVSDDAESWRALQALPAAGGSTDELRLERPARGRHVRVLMTRPESTEGYILSELEVYGRGGPLPRPQSAPRARSDGRLQLAAGAWRLQRQSLVAANGATLSQPGFEDDDWLPATVPGTALSSYWNAGAVPDPNFGDNQLMISDSFFYSDFWYRNEFLIPSAGSGRRVWLNFDGVNWKAIVFFNGQELGSIEGGFMRGRFDVTRHVRAGALNSVAVLVKKNATPGSVKEKTTEFPGWNGGALGADNPTYHASIGWDWIPTIRGRNCGIWGDVYLTTSGPVTIEDPFISTVLPLPRTASADVSVELSLRNADQKAVTGVLRGRFGDVRFEKQLTVAEASTEIVKLDPSTTPDLRLINPKLWWPNGYGDPHLYDVELSFETADQKISDVKKLRIGVRQFAYSDDNGVLKIWINGRRFIGRGGNWGFPESMLRYRAREYDVAVRYHKDMNFTMIRNWVGQTGDDAFYEACDKHGIVVWQDFWLANPVDGPNPEDNDLFLRNATDLVRRIRNHASIGIYCGRNEGDPPKTLNDGLAKLVAALHPGLRYIPNSAFGVVSGGGPYRAMPPKFYFKRRATTKLHSEMGMPNIVTMDSLRQMMPETDIWPQGAVWGLHDFCSKGAQGGDAFRDMIKQSYGGADNAADWVNLAQFINYNGYRAMFEAQSRRRMGLLLWMSHPAWPSFVWQTYDYYFEPTAAYFGAKKAAEPLHIQWNPLTDEVEVVNYSGGNVTELTAHAAIRNMDGSILWQKTATTDSAEDSVAAPIKMEYPSGLTAVHFITLKLTRGSETISENFYWRGLKEDDYRAIQELPEASLAIKTRVIQQEQRWALTTELENTSSHPALMVRAKAVREKSGDRILPALYSDNYLALMPGERRVIRIEISDADTRGERPNIVVEGFNVGEIAYR